MSGQLARLRDIFGDPLLVPAQRGMTPTARALELAGALHEALEGVRGVVTHGGAFDPATAELTVTVAANDATQYSVLMPFAVALRSRAPGLRLAFRGFNADTLEKQTETGEIDVAITPPVFAPASLRSRKLPEGRFVLIARRNHPIVRRTITLQQFLAVEHVITEPGAVSFSGFADEALAALGHRRKVVMSASSFLVVADIVARSDLIAVVPNGIVRDRADRLQIMEPPIEIPGFTTVIVWHHRNHAHAGHRWVRDALIESIERAPNV